MLYIWMQKNTVIEKILKNEVLTNDKNGRCPSQVLKRIIDHTQIKLFQKKSRDLYQHLNIRIKVNRA